MYSILYLYCKTFYKVLGSDYYNKYDYNVYHRKVLKFKNVKRFEYYSSDEVYYHFLNELEDLRAELEIPYFYKIFNRSKKRNKLFISGMGYFDNFIVIEFKDHKKEKIVIDEKEKYLVVLLSQKQCDILHHTNHIYENFVCNEYSNIL